MQRTVTYRMLLVCYLKSVLEYKCLVLDTYHPDTLYLRQQGCEDPWLFREGKRGPRRGKFGQHCCTLYYLLDVLLAAPVTIC